MKEDFSELIQYLDGKFQKVETDFNELKDDFNVLQTSVDAYDYKADKFFEDMIAEKLGIKLEY